MSTDGTAPPDAFEHEEAARERREASADVRRRRELVAHLAAVIYSTSSEYANRIPYAVLCAIEILGEAERQIPEPPP